MCTHWVFCLAFTQYILRTFTGITRGPGFPESVWCLLLYILQTAKCTLKRCQHGFVTPPRSIWVLRQKIDYVHPSVTNFIERLAKNSSIAAAKRNLKHYPSYFNVSRAALREHETNCLRREETKQSIPDPSNMDSDTNVLCRLLCLWHFLQN